MDIIIPGPNNELITGSYAPPPQYPLGVAAAMLYTPASSSQWDSAPDEVQEALDELARRVSEINPPSPTPSMTPTPTPTP